MGPEVPNAQIVLCGWSTDFPEPPGFGPATEHINYIQTKAAINLLSAVSKGIPDGRICPQLPASNWQHRRSKTLREEKEGYKRIPFPLQSLFSPEPDYGDKVMSSKDNTHLSTSGLGEPMKKPLNDFGFPDVEEEEDSQRKESVDSQRKGSMDSQRRDSGSQQADSLRVEEAVRRMEHVAESTGAVLSKLAQTSVTMFLNKPHKPGSESIRSWQKGMESSNLNGRPWRSSGMS